jgi:hypothetical protein
MWCVIDIQGYSNSIEDIIPKEVVIHSSTAVKKFVVSSERELKSYSKFDRKLIHWATKTYHKIPWLSGDTLEKDLINVLTRESADFDHIFTKGRDKFKFLSRTLSGKVIHDLTLYNCPALGRRKNLHACEIHIDKEAHCAVNTAKFLFDFVNGNFGCIAKLKINQSPYRS